MITMNLILTSDFPSTTNQAVLERMRSCGARPTIAWIPPFTDPTGERFMLAKKQFSSLGFDRLSCCDIDTEADADQLSHLEQFDILYLSGGDPLRFRQSILQSGLAEKLKKFLGEGRLVVAASGGSMQLTKNLSLFRLQIERLNDVLASRERFEALGLVQYELLPHLNRCAPAFIEKVRQYSESVEHDLIALADGAVVLHQSSERYQFDGNVSIFRRGVISVINKTA